MLKNYIGFQSKFEYYLNNLTFVFKNSSIILVNFLSGQQYNLFDLK